MGSRGCKPCSQASISSLAHQRCNGSRRESLPRPNPALVGMCEPRLVELNNETSESACMHAVTVGRQLVGLITRRSMVPRHSSGQANPGPGTEKAPQSGVLSVVGGAYVGLELVTWRAQTLCLAVLALAPGGWNSICTVLRQHARRIASL